MGYYNIERPHHHNAGLSLVGVEGKINLLSGKVDHYTLAGCTEKAPMVWGQMFQKI